MPDSPPASPIDVDDLAFRPVRPSDDHAGFRRLDHEVPGSGHLGCDSWYSLEL